jgi:hypothetical protein
VWLCSAQLVYLFGFGEELHMNSLNLVNFGNACQTRKNVALMFVFACSPILLEYKKFMKI